MRAQSDQNAKRSPMRLKGYDYSGPGKYFITICARNRECLFGEIANGWMGLNRTGLIVDRAINEVSLLYDSVEIDVYTIMPNHIHMIVSISRDDGRNTEIKDSCIGNTSGVMKNCRGAVAAPGGKSVKTGAGRPRPYELKPILGQVVAHMKYLSTKRVNMISGNSGKSVFQRNYYDHIIRNEESYEAISTYIETNPKTWDEDANNPKNAFRKPRSFDE